MYTGKRRGATGESFRVACHLWPALEKGPSHHGPCRAMDHMCVVHRGCVFGVLAMFGLHRRQRPNW